jgi:dolichyl-phosphate-mannose--protein O-mannosyl transferase
MGTRDSTPDPGRGTRSATRVLVLLFAAVATFYFVFSRLHAGMKYLQAGFASKSGKLFS